MNPCFECGKEAVADHHVVPRALGGTKTVPLCGGCHGKVHSPVSQLSTSALIMSSVRGRRPRKVDLVMFKRMLNRKGRMSLRKAAKQLGVDANTVHRNWRGITTISKQYAAVMKALTPIKKQTN